MEEEKKIITKEQAKSILALNDGKVHTFTNNPMALLGADHTQKSINESIEKAESLELTGDQAKAMKHGLAIFPPNAKNHYDILFVETNMEALEKLEQELEEKDGTK